MTKANAARPEICRYCRVQKEMGSQVLGSWNNEARVDSGLYRVREAAVAAVYNCMVRAPNALSPSVLWGLLRVLRYA